MQRSHIVDRGRGPEIQGTRITVYDVFGYVKAGRPRDCIAAILGLGSAQVQAALDYIAAHETEVSAVYEQGMERIQRGNPPWVEERLKQNRLRFEELVARCRSRRQGTAHHAEHHG